MKKNRNIEQLFVASKVYEQDVLVEPFEQYETFGQVDHNIIVSKKKILVYSSRDENGELKFYEYPSDKEVKETSFSSSYSTESNSMANLYCMCINSGYPMPIESIRKSIIEEFKRKSNLVGYFIPIEEYFKTSHTITSPTIAETLINLVNLKKRGNIRLSMNIEEAKEQLKKIGYNIDIKTKKIS